MGQPCHLQQVEDAGEEGADAEALEAVPHQGRKELQGEAAWSPEGAIL